LCAAAVPEKPGDVLMLLRYWKRGPAVAAIATGLVTRRHLNPGPDVAADVQNPRQTRLRSNNCCSPSSAVCPHRSRDVAAAIEAWNVPEKNLGRQI